MLYLSTVLYFVFEIHFWSCLSQILLPFRLAFQCLFECSGDTIISIVMHVRHICVNCTFPTLPWMFLYTWMFPSFMEFIGQNIRKLIKDGLIIKKPVAVHSRARVRKNTIARRKGRHSGYGKAVNADDHLAFSSDVIYKRSDHCTEWLRITWCNDGDLIGCCILLLTQQCGKLFLIIYCVLRHHVIISSFSLIGYKVWFMLRVHRGFLIWKRSHWLSFSEMHYPFINKNKNNYYSEINRHYFE